MQINDEYNMDMPNQRNAIDLFKGEWASYLPLGYESGVVGLFNDERIHLIEKEIGSFAGLDILELGPLEGGHSFMLEKMGANSIVSIEANKRAFLRCLIVKELLNMSKVKYFLGDFNKYIEVVNTKFDFILAMGVIYHMKNPIKTLFDILNKTNVVGFWSHYYDKILQDNEILKDKFECHCEIIEYDNKKYDVYKQYYRNSSSVIGFCGGAEEYSYWLPMETWLSVMTDNGFNFKILSKDINHPNGPAFTAIAVKN